LTVLGRGEITRHSKEKAKLAEKNDSNRVGSGGWFGGGGRAKSICR